MHTHTYNVETAHTLHFAPILIDSLLIRGLCKYTRKTTYTVCAHVSYERRRAAACNVQHHEHCEKKACDE